VQNRVQLLLTFGDDIENILTLEDGGRMICVGESDIRSFKVWNLVIFMNTTSVTDIGIVDIQSLVKV
jgi:hypothetical protein